MNADESANLGISSLQRPDKRTIGIAFALLEASQQRSLVDAIHTPASKSLMLTLSACALSRVSGGLSSHHEPVSQRAETPHPARQTTCLAQQGYPLLIGSFLALLHRPLSPSLGG